MEDLKPTVLPDLCLPITKNRFERRRHVRFPIAVRAELIERKFRTAVFGLATDIGAGGCYIEASNTFSEGKQVEVFLRCEGRNFHCHALVAYGVTQRGVGMGLAFTDIAPDQQVSLLDWVKQLGGEPALIHCNNYRTWRKNCSQTELKFLRT